MVKRGIIIANTGSPAAPTAEAVRVYLNDFLRDPRICPLPPFLWNIILKAFVLPKRSVASAQKYQMIWTEEGSPLSGCMDSLAQKLQESFLHAGDADTIVRHAMSYGEPSIYEVLAWMKQAGCEELVVIPLYPQGAYSTTLVVRDKVASALNKLDWDPALQLVENYSECKEYPNIIARSILDAGFQKEKDSLLFAFHSIPMKDIDAGDIYYDLVLKSGQAIAQCLGLDEDAWQIGFQCRFDKSRKWLGPSTGEAIAALSAREGRLFVVAPNFSIDCLETCYDIEVVLKQHYLKDKPEKDEEGFIYVPCLNDSDAHVALIRSIISE